MSEPRLRVKPKDRSRARDTANAAQYAAWYRFRTGYIRVPKQLVGDEHWTLFDEPAS